MHRLWKSAAIFIVCFVTTPTFAWFNLTAKKTDTINIIAEKFRPSGVAPMDMVIALRNANPEVVFKGLKPGMKLHIPSTIAEVRQAITGIRQKPAAQAASVKSQSSGSVASSKNPAKPTSLPAKKPSAKIVAPKTANHAVKPVHASSKPVPQASPISLNKPKTSTPVEAQAKAKAKAQPQAQFKAQIPANAIIPKAPSANQPSNENDLQQQLALQTQSLANDQAQIADLTNQVNELSQIPKTRAGAVSLFTGLWFILWVMTLVLYLRALRKNQPISLPAENISVNRVDPSFMPVKNEEPVMPKVEIVSVRQQVAAPTASERAFYSDNDDSRQVELDIASAIPFEPSVAPSVDEGEESFGERQNIIREIANDHDNIDWHFALLEFYIKTNNDAGFSKHMQTMVGTGLMSEGDTLWEKIRKMYLNTWVYKEEK